MRIGDYVVKPTSSDSERCLLEFLKYNGFAVNLEFQNDDSRSPVMVINVIYRDFFYITEYFLPSRNCISEIGFYNVIDSSPYDSHNKIFSNNGKSLVYEGYTLQNKPYGLGVAYYPNGNKYRDGIFGFKGILQGKEYYSTGQVKFEGIWSKNMGYGPNAPDVGNFFSENGELIFSGKFEIKKGGVGYPMIKYPTNYSNETDSPDISYFNSSDLNVY